MHESLRFVAYCSVDGLHSSDLTAYIALEPNSTMAMLAKQGVVYPNAYLPGPTDSFPGILALTTGNNATVTGVYYGELCLLSSRYRMYLDICMNHHTCMIACSSSSSNHTSRAA